ncbi:MAG TPA: ATP-dependent Clp protease adaptor ClpS [Kofleriaceae bacterium]|nr:ATP-dependent Clp protease adaptor ClpS [Kofleriaceae bacterium]
MSGQDRKTGTKRQEGTLVKERARTQKPPLYKVLLHNDDYTTKEFVVMVLQAIFHKSEVDANRIMLHVHENGIGVAGVYPYEIAETKIAKTLALARRYEYPLQLSMEPE